ncbi:MAG: class II fumarate hydratase [Fibrobacteria bacterium]|nr:class II fumarate hydratase [Fibrobacteria bacterium]
MEKFRVEKDSLGKVKVPAEALYGAQTQRAIDNFPISGIGFNRSFIGSLGLIKAIAAQINGQLGLIPKQIAAVVNKAALEVNEGKWDDEFPVDIYQTGSGTSTNMNANEVIANRAQTLLNKKSKLKIHPNDHVNFGQSSNDVIPTVIRIAAYVSCQYSLLPALKTLQAALVDKGSEYADVVKTGRTHLMDAMPLTVEQAFSGYARQAELGAERVAGVLERLRELPLGGTAVGTGINTHPRFASLFAKMLSKETGLPFKEATNHFEAQGTVDAPVELSGALKSVAVSVLKIVNDLRWMNSGPNAGLGELQLAALQPGSSIMPGKVNPVIEESTAMVCAQVIGNDTAINLGGIAGSFELNTMLPLVGHNLLESIRLLSNAIFNLADKSVTKITFCREHVAEAVNKNPILVTALNPIIGYEKAAQIAKKAFKENRSVKDVVLENTDLSSKQLDKLLDPRNMTKGGL